MPKIANLHISEVNRECAQKGISLFDFMVTTPEYQQILSAAEKGIIPADAPRKYLLGCLLEQTINTAKDIRDYLHAGE